MVAFPGAAVLIISAEPLAEETSVEADPASVVPKAAFLEADPASMAPKAPFLEADPAFLEADPASVVANPVGGALQEAQDRATSKVVDVIPMVAMPARGASTGPT